MSGAVPAPRRASGVVPRIGSRAGGLLGLAGVAVVLTGVVYALFLGTGWGLRTDRDLRFPQVVGDWRLRDQASEVFSGVATASFVVLGAAVVLGAFLAGRRRRAVIAALIIAGAPVLKELVAWSLAGADPVGGEAARASQGAFPSGHVAVATAIGLALVVVLPARLRPAGGVLAVAYATVIAVGVIALGWHYPSDIAGGMLLAFAWAAVVLGVLPVEREGPLAPAWRTPAAIAAGGAVVTAVLGAAAVATLPSEADPGLFVDRHVTFIVYGVLAGLLAILCVSAIAWVLSSWGVRPGREPRSG